jgi:hypothetical protein
MDSVTEDLYLNVEIPGSPATGVIPVTLGCSASFTVNPVAIADNGEQYPWTFSDGDEIFMIVSVNSNTIVRIDAVADGNMVRFTIPADICDQCTAWSTFRIINLHQGTESPLDPLAVGSFQRFDGA